MSVRNLLCIIWKIIDLSERNLAVASSTTKYVEKSTKVIITMADNNANGELFQLVTHKQTNKKPHPNPMEQQKIDHQFVTPICITLKTSTQKSTNLQWQ